MMDCDSQPKGTVQQRFLEQYLIAVKMLRKGNWIKGNWNKGVEGAVLANHSTVTPGPGTAGRGLFTAGRGLEQRGNPRWADRLALWRTS